MTPEQLEIMISYRIGQSHETLREAEILFRQSAFRGAVNRAYYAMFYSVLALLAARQMGTSKHTGVLSLFDREFVKTGIFPRELSKSLRVAFDRRQTYDYGEFVAMDEATSQETLNDANIFVARVENHLRSLGYCNKTVS
ncbi:MAG: HEPN domain-containing protein [Desulfococcaceae bacterium]